MKTKTTTEQVAKISQATGAETVLIQGDAVLLSPAEVEQLRVLDDIGRKIIAKTGEVGLLYRSMVNYIREQAVSPRFATWKLLQLGFHKVRVSEIIRVAMAPDDIYDQYTAATIGFGKALVMARIGEGGKVEHTPVLDIMAKTEVVKEDAFDAIEQEVINEKGDGSKPGKVDNRTKMLRAVNTIFRLAKRSAEWNSGDGWTLTLTKSLPVKKAGKETAKQ